LFKHVIISSLQSAFVVSLLFTIVTIPIYGGAATLFGLITFPFALLCCLIFAYPLITFRNKFMFSERINFIVYILSGFILGVFTPLLMLGSVGTEFSLKSITFLGIYGLLGSTCAVTAWNYVRLHVPYNKPIKRD
jgi:hypothetical protein